MAEFIKTPRHMVEREKRMLKQGPFVFSDKTHRWELVAWAKFAGCLVIIGLVLWIAFQWRTP